MELFQMPTEESMLQVCSMAPEKCILEYSAGMETSSKCFVSILPGGNYLNTPDTQRFSVKGSLDFIFRNFQLYTISFMPNLGIKDVVPIWAKKISA
jgi:hypothetical protein